MLGRQLQLLEWRRKLKSCKSCPARVLCLGEGGLCDHWGGWRSIRNGFQREGMGIEQAHTTHFIPFPHHPLFHAPTPIPSSSGSAAYCQPIEGEEERSVNSLKRAKLLQIACLGVEEGEGGNGLGK